ncbi:MAG: SlyX family protein [Pseudomonadota bacterium]
MSLENRITELEIQHAHHELTIEELNQIVIKQQSEIDNLLHYLKLLKHKIDDIQSNPNNTAEHTPPPHY